MSDVTTALLVKKYRDKVWRAISAIEQEIPATEYASSFAFSVLDPLLAILKELDEDIEFLKNNDTTNWGK